MSEAVFLLEREGTLLGRLNLLNAQSLAARCTFEPAPAFEPYRALFEEDKALAEQLTYDNSPAAFKRAGAVQERQSLSLTLRREGGRSGYRDFLLGIDGEHAEFRPFHPEEEPL